IPSLSSITFGFQLDAGVIHEADEKQGLAHLFEYMLFQGTKHKDARALNEAFETLGARKGASAGLETSMVWSRIVHNKFDATLELVQADFYRGTSLGRLVLGTNESVQALQRSDLQQFWQARYQPNNVLFSIAGKFDWEHVVEKMQTLFGNWSGSAAPFPEQIPHPSSSVSIELEEGKQEHIGMMFPFPNYLDPDYYAAMAISEVLGGNMASRLFVEVREKRGLVYGISAALSGSKHGGAMRVYAGTTPEQAHECMEVIVNELRKLEQEGVTADELERAKVQLKSEHVMRSEGSASRMGAIARSWWYERKVKTIQEMKEAIDAVTQEQILNVLHRFSPLNPLTVAAIGPLEKDQLMSGIL